MFIVFKTNGQSDRVLFTIDSVSHIDSVSVRKFIIHYKLQNLTNQKAMFFLEPNSVFTGSAGSKNTQISSQLFQEKEELPAREILSLSARKMSIPNFDSIADKDKRKDAIIKYLKENYNYDSDKELEEIKKLKDAKEKEDYFLKKSSDRLLKTLFTLEANETKTYQKVMYWDKKRYYKIDELEYYINEDSKYYLQFYFVALKEEYKESILPEEYQKIEKNPNFIKAWINSNKVEINFKE